MVFHFPPISGGGVVVAVGIANTFANLGHKVTVITPNVEWMGERYDPKIHPNIEIVKVETPSKSNIKIAARRCKENIKKKGIELGQKEKFDFIFSIFHPFHLVPRAAVSCGKKLGLPVIIKIDDAVYEKSSGLKSIQRKIETLYNSKTLQKATRILVSNQETKKIVSSHYNVSPDIISIVPNGIEINQFFTKNLSSKRVIFSGVMYYHRGLDVLY
jgi:glycosyltransferase involved in cell wall biosynthesis